MIVCKPYWKLFVNFQEIAKLLVFIVGIGSYFSDYTTNQGWNRTSCWGTGVKKKKKLQTKLKSNDMTTHSNYKVWPLRGCGLMVRVLELLHLMSDSSGNPNKAPIVHMVLSIVIMCRRVNESTLETSLFFIQKKEKEKTNEQTNKKKKTKYKVWFLFFN